LTIRAPFPAAHSIPARIAESSPSPASSSTLPLSSEAPGATPAYFPCDSAPVPAAMEATCVPWPTLSSAVFVPEKIFDAITRPLRSGCRASMPVSSTAMVTPLPLYVVFSALVAVAAAVFTGADWAADGLGGAARTASSQTFPSPAAAVAYGVPARGAVVSARHTAAASPSGAVTDSPSSAG
jgi:hypothetical protein